MFHHVREEDRNDRDTRRRGRRHHSRVNDDGRVPNIGGDVGRRLATASLVPCFGGDVDRRRPQNVVGGSPQGGDVDRWLAQIQVVGYLDRSRRHLDGRVPAGTDRRILQVGDNFRHRRLPVFGQVLGVIAVRLHNGHDITKILRSPHHGSRKKLATDLADFLYIADELGG